VRIARQYGIFQPLFMKEGSAAQLRRAAAGPRGGPAGARARRDRARSGSPGPSKLHPSRSKMLHIDHSDYTMIIPLERNVFRVDQWPPTVTDGWP
jgi:hypothetical protein